MFIIVRDTHFWIFFYNFCGISSFGVHRLAFFWYQGLITWTILPKLSRTLMEHYDVTILLWRLFDMYPWKKVLAKIVSIKFFKKLWWWILRLGFLYFSWKFEPVSQATKKLKQKKNWSWKDFGLITISVFLCNCPVTWPIYSKLAGALHKDLILKIIGRIF